MGKSTMIRRALVDVTGHTPQGLIRDRCCSRRCWRLPLISHIYVRELSAGNVVMLCFSKYQWQYDYSRHVYCLHGVQTVDHSMTGWCYDSTVLWPFEGWFVMALCPPWWPQPISPLHNGGVRYTGTSQRQGILRMSERIWNHLWTLRQTIIYSHTLAVPLAPGCNVTISQTWDYGSGRARSCAAWCLFSARTLQQYPNEGCWRFVWLIVLDSVYIGSRTWTLYVGRNPNPNSAEHALCGIKCSSYVTCTRTISLTQCIRLWTFKQ